MDGDTTKKQNENSQVEGTESKPGDALSQLKGYAKLVVGTLPALLVLTLWRYATLIGRPELLIDSFGSLQNLILVLVAAAIVGLGVALALVFPSLILVGLRLLLPKSAQDGKSAGGVFLLGPLCGVVAFAIACGMPASHSYLFMPTVYAVAALLLALLIRRQSKEWRDWFFREFWMKGKPDKPSPGFHQNHPRISALIAHLVLTTVLWFCAIAVAYPLLISVKFVSQPVGSDFASTISVIIVGLAVVLLSCVPGLVAAGAIGAGLDKRLAGLLVAGSVGVVFLWSAMLLPGLMDHVIVRAATIAGVRVEESVGWRFASSSEEIATFRASGYSVSNIGSDSVVLACSPWRYGPTTILCVGRSAEREKAPTCSAGETKARVWVPEVCLDVDTKSIKGRAPRKI